MTDKKIFVAFIDKKKEELFEGLKEGRFEEKQIYEWIDNAIKGLKQNPLCGLRVPKYLWPKVYVQKYNITNLWKYDLPNGWRLIYTIRTDEVMIVNVILEWFDHKEYEKRFSY